MQDTWGYGCLSLFYEIINETINLRCHSSQLCTYAIKVLCFSIYFAESRLWIPSEILVFAWLISVSPSSVSWLFYVMRESIKGALTFGNNGDLYKSGLLTLIWICVKFWYIDNMLCWKTLSGNALPFLSQEVTSFPFWWIFLCVFITGNYYSNCFTPEVLQMPNQNSSGCM
jgi:hypothetical protein